MKGCDERCSFCVVPVHARPRALPPRDDIVAEVSGLVARGVREVTLLGQTVNSYLDPRAPSPRPGATRTRAVPRAPARIAREAPGLDRLRYTSPHPRHLTPSLVRAHAELDVLCRPTSTCPCSQGSDRVLRRMIRRYTRAEYVARVTAPRAPRAPGSPCRPT
jgi:tRNA-2-methylthio-N6-dimethylallyladenosine synthase